jgi:hypothetical protein
MKSCPFVTIAMRERGSVQIVPMSSYFLIGGLSSSARNGGTISDMRCLAP